MGCHFLLQCMTVKSESEVKVKSLSRVRLLATPWTAAYRAPPSMGFSRQEYWSGVPLPSPRVRIEAWSPCAVCNSLDICLNFCSTLGTADGDTLGTIAPSRWSLNQGRRVQEGQSCAPYLQVAGPLLVAQEFWAGPQSICTTSHLLLSG